MAAVLSWLRQRRSARRARQEATVAGVLLYHPDLPGYPLMQRTGLRAGVLYPALARMEHDGRVTSHWEPGPYPRRRLYRLAEHDRCVCPVDRWTGRTMVAIAQCPAHRARYVTQQALSTGHAEIRADLDAAIAAALPGSGGRVRALLRQLQAELARVDEKRGATATSPSLVEGEILDRVEQIKTIPETLLEAAHRLAAEQRPAGGA